MMIHNTNKQTYKQRETMALTHIDAKHLAGGRGKEQLVLLMWVEKQGSATLSHPLQQVISGEGQRNKSYTIRKKAKIRKEKEKEFLNIH